MTDLVWSFAPWLVFLLASRVTSLYGAVAAGVVAAAVVLMRAVGRRRVHMLDVASTVYFVAFGAALIVLRPGHLDYWGRYAQAGSHIALTILVFGSILAGRPFTEAYARDTTPESVWNTETFHALNQRISTVWGLAFLVGTISLIAAGSVDVRQVLLRIIVPFGSLYYAYVFTQRQVDGIRPANAAEGLEEMPVRGDDLLNSWSWIWRYPNHGRHETAIALVRADLTCEIHRLRSSSDMNSFLGQSRARDVVSPNAGTVGMSARLLGWLFLKLAELGQADWGEISLRQPGRPVCRARSVIIQQAELAREFGRQRPIASK